VFKPIITAIILLSSAAVYTNITTPIAHASSDPVFTSWRNNVSAGGYDVVSYHSGAPVEGRANISTSWQGAQWHFTTQANLDTFLADPEKYAPAYGGYCAWALAKNKLAKGDPKHWTVKDGRLFLNYNDRIKQRWLADVDGLIASGDVNWPNILN